MAIDDYELRVLRSLRQIIRAVDIYSRKINGNHQVTVPQLLCLHWAAKNQTSSMSEMAKGVNLGTSTVNGIVDRLESKDLIRRERSQKDRRKVFLQLTEKGAQLVEAAPPMLQETFSRRLRGLPELEQAAISLSLEKIVYLMEAENIDASPNLISNNALGKEKEKADNG